jgi:hypothetical protein
MKRRLAFAILSLTSLCTVMLGPVPAVVNAATTPKDQICQGISDASGSGCNNGGQLTTVTRHIINIFSTIVGIVAVIMIMVSGFKYITAGGDSGNVSSAKSTLIYAIVGLVIVALAQAIVKFVLHNVK